MYVVRAARRLRDGLNCWAYLLTEDEQRSICTYRRDGRVMECPTVPGPGIGDSDAGVFVTTDMERHVA